MAYAAPELTLIGRTSETVLGISGSTPDFLEGEGQNMGVATVTTW